jgi:prepilin-type processing-associated H-X9-DG protein
MTQTPITAYYCPSRRQAKATTVQTTPSAATSQCAGLRLMGSSFDANYFTGLNTTADPDNKSVVSNSAAHNDYAGNGGQNYTQYYYNCSSDFGSATTTATIDNYIASGTMKTFRATVEQYANGIFYCGSTVTVGQITDGTSNTYLCGEKYMDPDYYETGEDAGDRDNGFIGDGSDNARWPGTDTTGIQVTRDQSGFSDYTRFGSAHAGGANMAFCDGSVRQISYGIASNINANFANRKDGKAIDVTDLSY